MVPILARMLFQLICWEEELRSLTTKFLVDGYLVLYNSSCTKMGHCTIARHNDLVYLSCNDSHELKAESAKCLMKHQVFLISHQI